MDSFPLLHGEITDKIINCFYTVYNQLRYGFLEKVYENAMLIELQKAGLQAVSQKNIEVHYDGAIIGSYFADIVVNDLIIVELKAAESICLEHSYQLLNYLKATNMEVGLLLNFGRKPEFARKTFTNDQK